MINYFLTNPSVSSVETAIPWVEGGMNGFILDQANFQAYCARTNLTVISSRPTSVDGLVIPVFEVSDQEIQNNSTPSVASVVPNEDVASPTGTEINERDCGVLGMKVVVHNGRGRAYLPIQDGKYHIWINAWAGGVGAPKQYPSRADTYGRFGRENGEVYRGQSVLTPTGAGVPLTMRDRYHENDIVMAELFKNNMYVLFPLRTDRVIREGYNEYNVLWNMLYPSVLLHPFDEEDITRFRESSRRSFVSFADRMITQTVDRTQGTIATLESEIAQYKQRLTANYSKLHAARRLATLYSQDKDARMGMYNSEYDRVVSLPDVETMTVEPSGSKMYVYTTVLTCMDERSNVLHELGKFRITLDIHNGTLRFENRTRQVGGFFAAHVPTDGDPCLGNLSEALPELFGTNEYCALVQMAIRYLRSANTDDQWGRRILYWPLANADDAEKYLTYWKGQGLRAPEGRANANAWTSSIEEDPARYPLKLISR